MDDRSIPAPEMRRKKTNATAFLNGTNQFASSARGLEELPEASDALQLDGKEQSDVHHALHREGHEEPAHAGRRHGEVVFLVCYV